MKLCTRFLGQISQLLNARNCSSYKLTMACAKRVRDIGFVKIDQYLMQIHML